jgi:hypothetical protein
LLPVHLVPTALPDPVLIRSGPARIIQGKPLIWPSVLRSPIRNGRTLARWR